MTRTTTTTRMDGTTEWRDAMLKDACGKGRDDEDTSDDATPS